MNKPHIIRTISEYNSIMGLETFHPLVSIVDFKKIQMKGVPESDTVSFGFYAISLKQSKNCIIRYGRNQYDFQEGTLVFLAPKQVFNVEPIGDINLSEGFSLIFHPDLIHGTSLGQRMKDYTFFSYEVKEALHISEREKNIVMEFFQKIDYELRLNMDKHSKRLIVANIELFLDYCIRFYDRQFMTRENIHKGILQKFKSLLIEYYQTDQPLNFGTPSVGYFADKLNLSANYLGDLIKKETGESTLTHIHLKLIEMAKEKMFDSDKTISEIAYELGFKYPQHFSRFFKQQVGLSPVEYRISNN